MTDAKMFSWILLSVRQSGSTRREISEMADAINHAVPTHREMETSLRWLQERARFRGPARTIFQTWDSLSDAIEEILQA